MIPVHVKAARRMCRQPGIVVRLLDQVFGAATLAVKPNYEINGLDEIGDEHPVLVLAALEQLILLGLVDFQFLDRFWFAQSHEPVCLAPSVRLIKEFALRVGIGLGRWLPLGLVQFLHQSRRFARTNHESGIDLFISFHGFPAVESRIGPAIDLLHARRQRCAHTSANDRRSVCRWAGRRYATHPRRILASRR